MSHKLFVKILCKILVPLPTHNLRCPVLSEYLHGISFKVPLKFYLIQEEWCYWLVFLLRNFFNIQESTEEEEEWRRISLHYPFNNFFSWPSLLFVVSVCVLVCSYVSKLPDLRLTPSLSSSTRSFFFALHLPSTLFRAHCLLCLIFSRTGTHLHSSAVWYWLWTAAASSAAERCWSPLVYEKPAAAAAVGVAVVDWSWSNGRGSVWRLAPASKSAYVPHAESPAPRCCYCCCTSSYGTKL